MQTANQDMKSPKAAVTDQEMRMIATKQELVSFAVISMKILTMQF